MERVKEKGFTQPASIVVKPIKKQGRSMYPLFSNSISYEREFVNSESWVFGEEKEKMSQKLREFFYIGDKYVFDSGDEYDKKVRKVIRMKRFKRILACAFIAFCATVVLLCSGVIAWVFVNGGSI